MGYSFALLMKCLVLLLPLTLLPIHVGEVGDDASDEVASTAPRKIRKLHLIRPDLIPFPLIFEIYC